MSHSIIAMQMPDGRQQTPRTNLRQTRTLLWLTCASTILSSVIFIVTMFTLGGLSFYMAPIIALLTVIYHTTILVIARRRAIGAIKDNADIHAPRHSPATTKWSIGLACFLCISWIAVVTITTMIMVFVGRESDDIVAIGGPQLVFEFGELGVLIAVVVVAVRARRCEPYGIDWYEL